MIAYNGEIYDHLSIRDELAEQGLASNWRGHSDTETLLAAIDAWGVRGALERATGMFAFALWDKAERTLILARDRLAENAFDRLIEIWAHIVHRHHDTDGWTQEAVAPADAGCSRSRK